MGLTFIAFEGYEIIVQAGEEVVEPRRNIPKAVFWSLAIVVPVYMLVAFVLVGASHSGALIAAMREVGTVVPAGLDASSPNWQVLRHVGELGLARSAAQLIPFGAVLILAGGVLSTMSALNATTFSSTRVSFAMGRDRNLPDAFARVGEARRTPHVALLWSAVLIVSMVAFVPITTVAAAADIMFLLLFLQVNIAVITLRKKYGDKLAYGYLMPFFPVVPILGIVTKLGLALFMFDHYPVAWLYVLLWIGGGFLLFHFYAAKRERPGEEVPVLAEELPLVVKPNSVLVAVAEPRSAAELVTVGARIAAVHESELLLLHVVAVPRQLPLRESATYLREGRAILDEVRGAADALGVPVRTLIRVAHRPAEAIIRTARDRNAEYLLMGWHGPKAGRRALIGRNIDRVIKDSNCHALIFEHAELEKARGRRRRILVPLSNPRTAPLASALVETSGGEVTVLHLTRASPEEAEADLRTQIETAARLHEPGEPEALFDGQVPIRLVVRRVERGVVEDIVSIARRYDRIVLGTSGDGFLHRTIGGETARRIAERAECPVVLARPKESAVRFSVQSFFHFFRELERQGHPEE
jgi:nucleotide-binding universal stress UspA family protein